MQVEEPRENYTTGWIKLYRSIQHHWLWERPYTKLEAWIDILMEANHSTEKVNLGNIIYTCERGEKMYSYDTWKKRWGWDKSKVRRFFDLLERESMVERLPNPKTTHIRICNYSTYQNMRHSDDTHLTPKRHPSDTHLTPIKELKNDKELKNERKTTVGDREIIIKDYFLDLLPVDSSEIFIKTWVEWVDYKKEIKNKLTIRSAKMQINFLLKQPDAVAVINRSITNGWKGLFELNGVNKADSGKEPGNLNASGYDPRKSKYASKIINSGN